VEQRLAACVNILAPCTSVYRWHDAVETASEVPLLIKTTRAATRLQAALTEAHPYELPEIIAVPLTDGLPAYLAWVAPKPPEPPPHPRFLDPSGGGPAVPPLHCRP
jgi:periplasmic divalent cation tolerance protein